MCSVKYGLNGATTPSASLRTAVPGGFDVATRRWHDRYVIRMGLKDAKNKLSELFTLALLGETVVITRQGESQSIRLTPVPPPSPASGFGMLREQLADLSPDWNSPAAETESLKQFEALDE